MLKPQKNRINKKDLKKDPLLDSLMNAQSFYEDNKNTLVYSAFAVLIVVVIFVWGSSIMEGTEMEATSLLGKAQIEYDQLNYSNSRDFLNVLKEGYSGTDAAEQGNFLLANLNFKEKRFVEAKQFFVEFTESYTGNSLLLSSAYAGIAACLETEDDFSGAGESYKKAYNSAGNLVQASEYLYLAGVNFQSAGDSEQAKEMFQKIIDEFPDSSKKYDAQTKMIQLALASK